VFCRVMMLFMVMGEFLCNYFAQQKTDGRASISCNGVDVVLTEVPTPLFWCLLRGPNDLNPRSLFRLLSLHWTLTSHQQQRLVFCFKSCWVFIHGSTESVLS